MDALRASLDEIEIVDTESMPWEPSPSPTVHRKRLYRVGPAESGVVTSVVRYDAGASFPEHPHPGGEEIFVLDGVFSDEHGSYPAGTFLLNPEGFSHAPFSREGCVLFVRLRQYAGDRPKVHVDTRVTTWEPGAVLGVEVLPLYREDGHTEEIQLTRLRSGVETDEVSFPRGEEIFVLGGELIDENGTHPMGTWLRFPPGSSHTPRSPGGCELYVKKGHIDVAA